MNTEVGINALLATQGERVTKDKTSLSALALVSRNVPASVQRKYAGQADKGRLWQVTLTHADAAAMLLRVGEYLIDPQARKIRVIDSEPLSYGTRITGVFIS